MFTTIVEVIFSGLVMGAIYSLASVGLSLIFGIMRVVNLAHGCLLVLGAFIAYSLYYMLIPNTLITTILAALTVFMLGLFIERLAIYPFRASEMRVLMITFGLGIIIEQIILLRWGAMLIMSPFYILGSIDLLGIRLSTQRLVLLAVSVILICGLWLFLMKSKLGKAVRTLAQDEEVAMIFGVAIERIRALTFALSSALAVIAGILLNSIYMFQAHAGWEYMLIALAIVIVGGLGDVRGTIIAGILLGLAESFVGYLVSPSWKITCFFISIIITLMVRPSGIFRKGKET
ncbi:MAG: branched-chain amino acid ABC transporter permease [Candidatus Bathyarchaeia archaeon]